MKTSSKKFCYVWGYPKGEENKRVLLGKSTTEFTLKREDFPEVIKVEHCVEPQCICTSSMLYAQGCQCGAFKAWQLDA